MSTATREQASEWVAGLGPLQNVFLIAADDDTFGLPIVWHPEIGLRYVIIEKNDLAHAVYDYLREAGVRRFKSETELGEAQRREQWEGWNTCSDFRRMQQAMEEVGERGKQ
jgi:hypothetical protein